MHIKKGDIVAVRSGDDKGKTGKVIKSLPAKNKVIVEGVNVMKKHERARAPGQKGQLVDRPMPISVSSLMIAGESKEAKKEPKAKKATASKAPKK